VANCSNYAVPGNKTIVDEKRRAAFDQKRRPTAAVQLLAPFHFSPFARQGALNFVVINTQFLNRRFVETYTQPAIAPIAVPVARVRRYFAR
jgi:hypothetical protein